MICQCDKCSVVVPAAEAIVDVLHIGREALEKATSIQDTSSSSVLSMEIYV